VLLESLIMIATYVTHHVFYFAGITTQLDPATSGGDSVSRVGGTVGGPNAAAAFLDLLLAPVLSLALVPVRRAYRLMAAGAFAIGCIALVLTQSRGGWIAVGVSCGIVIGYAWYRGWIPGLAPTLVLIGVGVVVFLLRNELLTRFSSNDGGSASSRIPLIRLAFHMIEQHPLFGVGANNFGINISRYATPEFNADWLYTVHNRFILIWAEDGIGALVAFVVFLFGTLRGGWRCRRISDQALALLSIGLMAGVLGQIIHMMVDILNGRQQVQLLVIVAGLLAALVAIKRESDPVVTPTNRWAHIESRPMRRRAAPGLQPVPVSSRVDTRRVGGD
jgi:putative inorganic carbon (HCO3(-)) transporter